jgi:tetratricopeptide (TPR) repeat protein/predicted Ser/Thr protein kinase
MPSSVPGDFGELIRESMDQHLRSRETSAESSILGPFRLIRRLGEGGAGEVWLATDALGRQVAVKLLVRALVSDPARFSREGMLAAQLNHPNIVPVYEMGAVDGRHYISMGYVQGKDLDSVRLDTRAAVRALVDICGAVHYAHERGIIHRDLKPGNVILGDDGRVYLTDFGLAKALDSNEAKLTRTGVIMGTPGYMSPEQARGQPGLLDVRTDVYSLGGTLYTLLTGKEPFEPRADEDMMAILTRVVEEELPPPRRIDPSIPADLDTIVLKAMAKDPSRRYPTAKEMAEDLQRWLDGEPIRARRAGIAYRLRKKIIKHRWIVLPSAVALLTLLGFAATQAWDYSAALREFRAGNEAKDAKQKLEHYRNAMAWIPEAREKVRMMERVLHLESAHNGLFQQGLESWNAVMRLSTMGRQKEAQARAKEARALFDQANRALEKPEAHLYRGRCLSIEGDRAGAAAAWEQGLRLDPQHPSCRVELVKSLLEEYQKLRGLPWIPKIVDGVGGELYDEETEEQGKLRARAERELKALPSPTEEVRAMLAMARGDFKAAAALFALHTGRESWDAAALRLEGTCWYFSNDFERAVESFSRSIALSPTAGAYDWRAKSRKRLGQWKEAAQDAERAIDLENTNPVFFNNRGGARRRLGDLPGALEDFNRTIELDPKSAVGHFNRGIVELETGEFEKADQDLTRALELDPRYQKDAMAFFNRGFARQNRGAAAGALSDYSRALELKPGLVEAWFNRGNVHYSRSDFASAVKDYDEAIRLDSSMAAAYASRGASYYGLSNQQPAQALDHARKAVADLEKGMELGGPSWPSAPAFKQVLDLARARLANLQRK